MSALGDKLHAFFGRFTSVAHKDVEEIVSAVESHLVPVIQGAVKDALTTVEADGKSLLDQLKTDEVKLAHEVATEVAKLFGRNVAEAPAPAPAAPAEKPAGS